MTAFPGSDMIVEVARAADPRKRETAMMRLAEIAGASGPRPSFAKALSSIAEGRPLASNPTASTAPARPPGAFVDPSRSSRAMTSAPLGSAANAAQKFEAYVLQTFVEQVLPRTEHGFYGDAVGGGIWRSMMAEQLAASVASSGGVGLQTILRARLAGLGPSLSSASPRGWAQSG